MTFVESLSPTESAGFSSRISCIACGGAHLEQLSSGRFDEGAVGKFIHDDPWGEHPAPFLHGKVWSYVACRDCKQAFHQHILDPTWNERRFSKWMSQEAIEAYELRFKTSASEFNGAVAHTSHVLCIERLTRDLRGAAALRVLDFGCGYGGFLAMCSMYGFEAYGVDRSSAKRDNNRFAKVFADIDDVVALAPFHVLTLFEVLEHLDEPAPLLERLGALLAPGGLLILETPDCTGVRDIESRSDYDKIHPLEHINGFTPASLKAFAERLGYVAIPKPAVSVASETTKFVKSIVKRVVRPVLKPTTQLYFRKRPNASQLSDGEGPHAGFAQTRSTSPGRT